MNIITSIPPNLGKQWVGVDLEIFQMTETHRLHRPQGKFACLTIALEDETVYFIEDEKSLQRALDNIKDCVWCLHNAKFDIIHLRRWAKVPPRKKIWDTMLIDKILYGGLYDTFSLKDLVRRHLQEQLSKEARELFQEADKFNEELIEYSVIDPIKTLHVALQQRKLMDETTFKVWANIDRPALWAFCDFVGFPIDPDCWKDLAQEHKKKQEEIDEKLPINPRSSVQVVSFLKQHGFKGIKDSQAKTLDKMLSKYPDTPAVEFTKLIKQSRKYGKYASTYGMTLIDKYVEQDANGYYLLPDWSVIGAESGRTSCSSPNLQNIPARETKSFRKCFKAHPGYKLIIWDYSSQEPRILAYLSKDEQLLHWFTQGKDVYIEVAQKIFNETILKSDPRRQDMKTVFLGLTYGLTKYGLAEEMNLHKIDENSPDILPDVAQELLDAVLDVLPGVRVWMGEQTKQRKYVTTPFGRRVWLNPYTNQCERNAMNAPCQGGAADMMKIALGEIYYTWPFDFPFCVCGYIHDELVAHVPEEYESVGIFVKNTMELTATELVGNLIPFPVEYHIGETWAEK